jgi:DNA-binding FadR family transcriptional regulator
LAADLRRVARRRAPKTSEVIAVDLADYIISAQLAEGTVLPNEREMADQFGVGRASIREALRLLETRGMVRMRPGPKGGPVIRRPSSTDFSSTLEFALQLERATLAEVIRAREDLGPVTAKLAASRATSIQLRALREALKQLDSDLHDQSNYATQGRRFEALLGEASGSVVVRIVVDAINAILWDTIPSVAYTLQRRRAVASSLHEILDAVESGDAVLAEHVMDRYVRSGARYWRRFHADLFSKPVRWTG